MEKLYKIKEALTQALEDSKTAKTGELQAGEIDAIHKLAETIKNLEKICMLAEQGGYSQDGRQGVGGSSYANRGQHYVLGHYSRGGGMDRNGDYSSRRDSRGRYSRGEGTEEMMEYVRMAIESAPDEYREDLKRFMRELENA